MVPIRVYEIFFAELGAYVKFKVLDPAEIEIMISELEDLDRDEYIKKILEKLVYNMKSEIVDSLRMMSRSAAKSALESLFNGCVMLNPGLDIEVWVSLAYSLNGEEDFQFNDDGIKGKMLTDHSTESPSREEVVKPKKLSKAKFLNLERYLKEKVIGQDQATEALVKALKRSQVGLNDEKRPLGVFLFSGSSGVGKTLLAQELNKYLYGNADLVRVDCGEYQHKHDNQKLIGSPPGYYGHEDGGQLANSIRKNPNTVVLLDEVEKANVDIWDTFLRVFDEGAMTDNKGRRIDFCNTIIIMTTNLGNNTMVEHLTDGGVGFNSKGVRAMSTKIVPARTHLERVVNEAVKKKFSPEFLNRIDKTIVFNYLQPSDYLKIADLEMRKIDEKLSRKGIAFKWDERVLELLVEEGVDSISAARGLSQVRRDRIENLLADKMINAKIVRGSIIELDVSGKDFMVSIIAPEKKKVLEEN